MCFQSQRWPACQDWQSYTTLYTLRHHRKPQSPSHPGHPDSRLPTACPVCPLLCPTPCPHPPARPNPGPRLPFHASVGAPEHAAEQPSTWPTGFTSNSWPQTSTDTHHCQKSCSSPLSHPLRGAPHTLSSLPEHLLVLPLPLYDLSRSLNLWKPQVPSLWKMGNKSSYLCHDCHKDCLSQDSPKAEPEAMAYMQVCFRIRSQQAGMRGGESKAGKGRAPIQGGLGGGWPLLWASAWPTPRDHRSCWKQLRAESGSTYSLASVPYWSRVAPWSMRGSELCMHECPRVFSCVQGHTP